MNTKQEIGHAGEQAAIEYLEQEGYRILERNWRIGHREVDIICTDGELIIIVEVKTREKGSDYPSELLDARKRRNLLAAGAAYLAAHQLEKELRFDLMVVNKQENEIQHIREAIQVFD